MAQYPAPPAGPRFRGVRSSTILTKGQGPNLNTGKQVPVLGQSKALAKAGTTRVTAEDVKDPARLVKIINDLQAQIDRATVASRSNPHNAPCIVRNIPMSNGVGVVIPHTLGRPLTGWWCVGQSKGAPAFGAVRPLTVPSIVGPGPDQVLILVPVLAGSGVGNYDICITGD